MTASLSFRAIVGTRVGSTPVTVSSNRFGAGEQVTCKFGSTASPASYVSSSTVVCYSPQVTEDVTEVSFSLSIDGGSTFTSSEDTFRYSNPTVQSVTPPFSPLSGGGTVTVTGSNFEDSVYLKCMFGEVSSPVTTLIDASTVTCEVPPGTAGEVFVEVTVNGVEQTSSKLKFSYTSTDPVPVSVSPSYGGVDGGTSVLVKGYGFVDSSLLRCSFGGRVKLSITWWQANKGALLLTLVDGHNFRVPSMFKSAKGMDPYCMVHLGNANVQTLTVSNGGKNPVFNNEHLIWCDDKAWKEDMKIVIMDNDVGRDAIIGECKTDVLHVMTPKDITDTDAEGETISNKLTKKKKDAGELRYSLRFLPCARLTVKCVGGRNIRNPDSRGKADPYLVMSLDDSQIKDGVQTRKTPPHSDGGGDPQWNYDVEFDILDQYEMTIKAFDKDLIGSDDIIGTAAYSLLPLFRKAVEEDDSDCSATLCSSLEGARARATLRRRPRPRPRWTWATPNSLRRGSSSTSRTSRIS